MGNGSSIKLAAIIAALVIVYFGVRAVFNDSAPAGDERSSEAGAEGSADFAVIVSRAAPEPWQQRVLVRGRTKAIRTVTVRSESNGVISSTPVEAGTLVKQGDVLCKLRVDSRQAQVSQARAAIDKARIEYNAARELKKEGFSSTTALASAKAALDLATANLTEAELGLQRSVIRAPFDGTFDERMAEAGDLLRAGDPCGVLIQQSPFLVVGAVSEKDVGKVALGDTGVATLATGETVEGRIRYVARAADPATRTFDVELEIPNDDSTLRDGVTAEFSILANRRNAYLVKRSALVLADNGTIGVRTVDDEGLVAFLPVNLLGDSAAGVWVAGLPGPVSIITRGQEYVSAGQIVNFTFDDDAQASRADIGATGPGGADRETSRL